VGDVAKITWDDIDKLLASLFVLGVAFALVMLWVNPLAGIATLTVANRAYVALRRTSLNNGSIRQTVTPRRDDGDVTRPV
jgi:hypothetical protein